MVLVAISLDWRNPQSGPIDIPFWRYTPQPAALAATDLLAGGDERWTERQRVVGLTPDRPYALWRLSPSA